MCHKINKITSHSHQKKSATSEFKTYRIFLLASMLAIVHSEILSCFWFDLHNNAVSHCFSHIEVCSSLVIILPSIIAVWLKYHCTVLLCTPNSKQLRMSVYMPEEANPRVWKNDQEKDFSLFELWKNDQKKDFNLFAIYFLLNYILNVLLKYVFCE